MKDHLICRHPNKCFPNDNKQFRGFHNKSLAKKYQCPQKVVHLLRGNDNSKLIWVYFQGMDGDITERGKFFVAILQGKYCFGNIWHVLFKLSEKNGWVFPTMRIYIHKI